MGRTVRAGGRDGAREKVLPAAPPAKGRSPLVPLLLLLLALLPLASLWPLLHADFVSYDDPEYVTLNENVRRGLSWAGAAWAFTTNAVANWHPLTWLSHMADVSLFGLNPSGHHATNLGFHLANTLLLFLLFRSLTGRVWPSAWVAALFAVHPAHVESVAWVAERKDLLSGAFWLATIWAYASWVRRRGAGRYLAVLLLFAAGLMSKPMVVSLPLVLLLLDYWPLRRFGGEAGLRAPLRLSARVPAGLIREKAPLFLMSAVSSIVTFLVQRAGGAVQSLQVFSFWTRVGNALVAYVRYLGMLFWPADLAVFYPHPGMSLPLAEVLGAALLLAALTAGAVALRQKAPYLLVGWLWFLITLLPVIGLVQVGVQALADRYTYIPFIGPFVAVVWGVSAVASRWKPLALALKAVAAAVLLFLALAAAAQARHWRNSETLYLHAIAVTKDNPLARNNLGDYYNDMGRPADALQHLSEAVRIDPTKSEYFVNQGRSLMILSRLGEAEQQFRQALRLKPDNAAALNNLARARFLQTDVAESIRLYQAASTAEPKGSEIRRWLAIVLLVEGNTAAAREQLEIAVRLAPSGAEYRQLLDGFPGLDRNPEEPLARHLRRTVADAHRELAVAFQLRRRNAAAAAHFRKALELYPGFVQVRNDLGALLAEEGHRDEAEAQFRSALTFDPRSALAHSNMGYMLYLKGRRQEAIDEYREALRLQPGFPLAQNNLELALRGPAVDEGARRE
jgi:protein O-mannosyl-transferase